MNQAASTTTVASSANPSTFGQGVTFTATVSPAGATGTVQFKVDGATLGTPVTLSGGTATSSSVTTLTVGTHTVTADYSGDTSFAASSGTLPGGQVVQNIQGDTNLDGQVTSVDALCVLRSVVGLGATTACPAVPNAILDVNSDTQVTSVDALCVLRIVANLPGTPDCPLGGAGAAASGTAISSGGRTGSGGKPAGSGQVSVQPSSVKVAPGGSTTIEVQASTVAAAGLGAWTVELTYDPSVVQVTSCTMTIGSAVCNAGYKTGVIRLAGASSAGLAGTQTLATVTFTAVGKANSLTKVDVAVPTLADATGAALKPSTSGSTIRVTK